MFDDDLAEFAVRGEDGIDLFQRLDDEGRRRTRYRCVATLRADGTLADHAPEAGRDPAVLRALAEGLALDPLAAPLSLADPGGWPAAAGLSDPLKLFLYLDFCRAWQVADMAGARFETQAARGAAGIPSGPGTLAGAVAPLFDFNRMARGLRVTRALLPALTARIAAPGFADDSHGGTGFALRMLGDLCLRGGEAALALGCFEAAVAAGDNPFRRRRAIEAARTAGDPGAADRHRAAYAARWKLPADLAEDAA